MTAIAEPNQDRASAMDSRLAALAPESVTCPTCKADGGEPCQSTGGGNFALVPTHKARCARVAGWSEEQCAAAGRAAWQARPRDGRAGVRPAGVFEALEAAALPIRERPGLSPEPAAVRLSVPQCREVERMAAADGRGWMPTAHLRGDAARRRTVLALERAGIVSLGAHSDDGYARETELTEYGWQVHHQHRLINRSCV